MDLWLNLCIRHLHTFSLQPDSKIWLVKLKKTRHGPVKMTKRGVFYIYFLEGIWDSRFCKSTQTQSCLSPFIGLQKRGRNWNLNALNEDKVQDIYCSYYT